MLLRRTRKPEKTQWENLEHVLPYHAQQPMVPTYWWQTNSPSGKQALSYTYIHALTRFWSL